MGIVHDWGKKVDWSEGIAAAYVPFSDYLLPGPFMPHQIFSIPGAAIAGLAVSFVANQIYDLIKTKMNWTSLEYHSNQSSILHLRQLGVRAILHIAVGGGMGFVVGLIASGSGATAAMGAAVGLAAFVGPQLARVIYKVFVVVHSLIFTDAKDFREFKEELASISKKYVIEGMVKGIFLNVFDNEEKLQGEVKTYVENNIKLAFDTESESEIQDLIYKDENSMFGMHPVKGAFLKNGNLSGTRCVNSKEIKIINKIYQEARKILPNVKKRIGHCHIMSVDAFSKENIDINAMTAPKDKKFLDDLKENLDLIYKYMMERIFEAAVTGKKDNLKLILTKDFSIPYEDKNITHYKKITFSQAQFINNCFSKARELFFVI